jgi:hypothetical protein
VIQGVKREGVPRAGRLTPGEQKGYKIGGL